MEKIILKKGKERAIYNRHPWVYSGAVMHLPKAENGDIVEVREQDGSLCGYGFFSPQSQLVCRVFEFTTQPAQVEAAAYWTEKIRQAYALRDRLVANAHTNAFRLINAEGDFFPGIIADVYADTVVLQLLIKGTEKILPFILEGLAACGWQKVYLKGKDVSQRLEEVTLPGGWLGAQQGSTLLHIAENGVQFEIDIEKGQKTGFFLDQRDNRHLLGTLAAGRKVLNTFAYSGGFSLYALRAGAEYVHSVDSSRHAIDLCEQNVALNNWAVQQHKGICADCFEYLKQDRTPYDLIVLDPPAFAKNARAVPNATRGYKELNLLAFKRIAPGGLVFTFSCSQKIERDLFRKIVFGAAADARRNIRIVHQLTQPPDHPINIYHPENEYLKGLVLHVE